MPISGAWPAIREATSQRDGFASVASRHTFEMGGRYDASQKRVLQNRNGGSWHPAARSHRRASGGSPSPTAADQLFAGRDAGGFRQDGRQDGGGEARNHGAADEAAGRAVRPERPARQGRHHVSGQADSGGRAGKAARRREIVGRLGGHVARGDSPEGAVARGVPALAAPQPSRGRHGVSQAPHRRDQEAGRARPDAVRPGLRSAGALLARVSARHLPDDSSRPRRRVAGAGGHVAELLQAVQRHPESEAVGGPAAAGDSVPAAAVQRDR